MKTIRAVDLFCGAGGSSTGLDRACNRLDRRLDLVAVNHWAPAIETHSANHPKARHYCEPIDSIDPRKAVPAGKLDLLWASPECTHHSNARGGKPMCDQSRSSAWCVLRWATALQIDTILVENVREFESWGPLSSDGRPLKRRRGETFTAWVKALESLGYRVSWRVLNAADYGDPTTRERLFVQARRGRKPIAWPEPTHAPGGARNLFGERKPWRAAREIIDWAVKGESIFRRKKPLRPRTLQRIEAGLRRFGGAAAEPFLVLLRRHSTARSLDEPLPTLTAGGEHVGLVQPFIATVANSGDDEYRSRSIDAPLPSITAGGNRFALVEPFLVHTTHGGERRPNGLGEPLPTVTGANRGEMALVEPFVIGQQSGAVPRSTDEPLPTVAAKGAISLVEPFLVKYTRTGGSYSVDQPVDTITTRDRFGLVESHELDILFRMLTPRELARGQGFPDGYTFRGNREQTVRQIGNAVPPGLAEALCLAVLTA